MSIELFFMIAGLGIFLYFHSQKPKPTTPSPPPLPPETHNYSVSVKMGDVTIENLIIADVPRPFVEASVQAEVQALVENYTRRWSAIYSKGHEADDAAYRSLEHTLMVITSPHFTVRRAVVKHLPAFEHNEEPSAGDLLRADVRDRAETLKIGRELLDTLPDDPEFGAVLNKTVKNIIANDIERESLTAHRRQRRRVVKSYR